MSLRTTAAARQNEMNASIAVEATSTRCGPAARTFGVEFDISVLTLDPNDLMAELPKTIGQSLFAASPPGPLKSDQDDGRRPESSPKSLLPISRVHDLG